VNRCDISEWRLGERPRGMFEKPLSAVNLRFGQYGAQPSRLWGRQASCLSPHQTGNACSPRRLEACAPRFPARGRS
jgi:hypothetical protein